MTLVLKFRFIVHERQNGRVKGDGGEKAFGRSDPRGHEENLGRSGTANRAKKCGKQDAWN